MVLKYLQKIYKKKIQEPSKKLCNKKHGSYKDYVFYEDGNEYIPLKINFLDVHGYYNIFKGDSKTMNFKLDDNSLEKLLIYLMILGKY